MTRTLVNLGLYEAGWFAAILCASRGLEGWAAAAPFALAAVHLALVRRPAGELALLVAAGAAGCAVDTVLIAAGAFQPSGQGLLPGLPPAWLAVLWVQLATLLRFSLRWLSGRPLLAAGLGAVGGPVAILAGARLGAAAFPNGALHAVAMLAPAWALATPLLLGLSGLLERVAPSGGYRFER